jgi:hypothetical protein
MQDRIQLVSIIAALLVLGVILELVRRRRLMERYALLWLGSGLVLLGLAIWRDALAKLSHSLGIFYPPNALFLIAFGFVLFLLLHFSLAVSRLSDQTKVLAQRLALLEERVRVRELPVSAAQAQDREQERREEDLQADDDQRRREHSQTLL